MATPEPTSPRKGQRIARAAQFIIVSSVMFTFISYWRTAAVVLCDLASTAYYIGGIVEQSIGPAAPWFILAVMVFSYAVRSVYIESSALFVRGGVYRVVKEAMGGFLAKLSVSALMFDYILTGPISGVSAGQYIMGLGLATYSYFTGAELDPVMTAAWKNFGSVVIACGATLYFFRQNLLGIHESSDKALKIMIATTIMAVVIIGWCGLTLAIDGVPGGNSVLRTPNLEPKPNPSTGEMQDPLGFISSTGLGQQLRDVSGRQWLSIVGMIGICIAFGQSILAMSGEETLAQVYREVEAPKLKNFKKAAFIVFIYSLVLTGGISFLAVLLIPDNVRMAEYADNLIGGLAMNVVGPLEARLLLNAFVVIVGFLILSGAVNTAIIGSNGVLNRVAEDGVLPEWFRKPHPRFGTSYRILYLILGLQLFTILVSRGDTLLLGEAYAFGVVWSFVFKAAAMVVLRFKDHTPREYKVPLNLRIGSVELPIGLGLIFIVLVLAAIANLLTKETATIWGLGFTLVFLAVFVSTEWYHERRLRGKHREHIEHFNEQTAPEITTTALNLTKKYRRLVAIRSPWNLFMLEKTLRRTDPATTDVIVMTAKILPTGDHGADGTQMDSYEQQLMTTVVDRAEKIGKEVKLLVVPTNNPLHAVLKTAQELGAQEIVVGASNKFTAEEQLDQIAFYWINLHDGQPAPMTVRILSKDRDITFDLEGGNRIPDISERQARSIAELRAAGIGISRVLLLHDGLPTGSDLFANVMTMLDPSVSLDLAALTAEARSANGQAVMQHDRERAHQVGREVGLRSLESDPGQTLVHLARKDQYDLIIVTAPEPPWLEDVLQHSDCAVFIASLPRIPEEVEEA
jgi:amino acid transporter/nucleotide-binding universal stress UspA family protein